MESKLIKITAFEHPECNLCIQCTLLNVAFVPSTCPALEGKKGEKTTGFFSSLIAKFKTKAKV
jgi:hypothetical protein